MSDATLVSTTLAGTISSFAESTITYPLEYLKARRQIAFRPLSAQLPPFAIPHITSVMYQGWSAFVVGNVLKTWLRFNVFNSATKFMTDGAGGRAGAPVVVVSGMMTGIAETLVVVPFESIKTTMIEASALGKGAANGALPPLGSQNTRLVVQPAANAVAPKPQQSPSSTVKTSLAADSSKPRPIRPKGPPTSSVATASNAAGHSQVHPIVPPQDMLRTIRHMYRTRGLRAFVQGFNPTVSRQVTNSVVRFTGWNAWTQLMSLEGEERMPLHLILVGSAVTATVEAVATQPLDVIKTRMETANGRAIYGNSLVCAYKMLTEEGWQQMFAGLGPRWMRKWIGGGIMWAVYELSFDRIDKAMKEHPFK